MFEIALFDAKSYDRRSFERAENFGKMSWRFLDFRLNAETAAAAQGANAVCVFVNDRVDRSCLEILARQKVKLVALRCAGFNNVDVKAATELGLCVVRVPA